MNCVCGHPEKDHVGGGRCRVPDCPCERFRPGDTLTGGGAAWTGPRSTLTAIRGRGLLGVALALATAHDASSRQRPLGLRQIVRCPSISWSARK